LQIQDDHKENGKMNSRKKTDEAAINVIHPSEFSQRTAQTPGATRMSAISSEQGVASSQWGGIFFVDPLAQTGIHHHREQETIVYALEGEAVVRWGDHGEHTTVVRPGDFLHVPAWLPHQELNPSQDQPFRWVVVRSTSEPIVVNLPESFWDG
jgi:uncharacterized RmlC-like cupin family protein